MHMSKRLQVLFDEKELEEIQSVARRNRMTVAEWVRQALRDARGRETLSGVKEKLAAVKVAALYEAPSADIDQMLAEIEAAYAVET